MPGLPAISMEGRAGADPDLRFTPNGKAVAHLRVAAQERKYQDGGWVDGVTCWLDVSAFGKLAENIAESVEKGDLLTIVGSLTMDEWDDRQTGEKRTRLKVLADQVSVSLKFRTVRHGEGRAERSSGRSEEPTDPWSTPAAATGGSTGQVDEPPF